MIFDSVKGLKKYIPAIPQLEEVIRIIEGGDLTTLPAGQYSTDTEGLRYMINEYKPTYEDRCKHEYHATEIDVHVMLYGRERCTYSTGFADISKIDPSVNDIGFVVTEREEECVLTPGNVVIYFPGELHRPALSETEKAINVNRKAIFKIKYSL